MVRLCLAFAAVVTAGCGNDLGLDNADGGGGDNGNSNATGASTGLPCEIESILASRCQSCHGEQPAGGAPMSLVTYDDLTAKNTAGVMFAQRCLDRMTSRQMPPAPATVATAAEIATFRSWVTAGTPNGECAGNGGGSNGSNGGGPFDGPPVCTSGTLWTGGNRESPLMHPGVACINCHAAGEGPRFKIAGTVYPTGHEPNDCNGATAATVEVTDAHGAVVSLPVNGAGNFSTSATIAFPIHVAIVKDGKRRAMSASPPVGDCNMCHTQTGAQNAPGRIVVP
jgi:hypothetical protein